MASIKSEKDNKEVVLIEENEGGEEDNFGHFKRAIVNGDFDRAKQLSIHMDLETLTDKLYFIEYNYDTIAPYGFVNYLLLDKESSDLHYLASYLLVMGYSIEGMYQTAFFHAKRAVQLSPKDYKYKEYLLLFYEFFTKLLSKEEATGIAKEILKSDPNNRNALLVLKQD